MATQSPPPEPPDATRADREKVNVTDVELLRVLVTREGQRVSTQWALHPQLKQDLLPAEYQEVSELMLKVTALVGKRFAAILSSVEPDPPGTA